MTIKSKRDAQAIPFENAEEAWLWFISAQQARNDGAQIAAGKGICPRPCEPTDIFSVVERLYRNRRLVMDHLLVLRHYGRRQIAPDPRRMKEVKALALWREALERIESVLVRKGIVSTRPEQHGLGAIWARPAILLERGEMR